MSTSSSKTVRQIDQSSKTGKPESAASINVCGDGLMDRVVSILEQARANVVRAVNSNMVIAYWLIGREIVLELQGGEDLAEYGKQVIENLSGQLISCSISESFIRHIPRVPQLGAESSTVNNPIAIPRPMGAELATAYETINGFSSQLSWSLYRALMRVVKPDARDFGTSGVRFEFVPF